MGRFVFAVHSNPVEGLDAEYNDWYSNRHLDDLLACPGVITARRLKLAQQQVRSELQPFRYFSLYEIETDDLQGFINELLSRAGSERMPRSSALGDTYPVFWEVIEK
jgi:hypothetical protein